MSTDFKLEGERPKREELTRKEIKELIGLCRREVGYTGISQDAGKRALALRAKLEAMLK